MNEHTRLTIDGLSLRARSALRDDAPQLLLTNAWPQSIRCWDDQWDALAERFSLLAVDLPGFGRSEGRRSAMTPTARLAVLAQLVRRLERGGSRSWPRTSACPSRSRWRSTTPTRSTGS